MAIINFLFFDADSLINFLNITQIERFSD